MTLATRIMLTGVAAIATSACFSSHITFDRQLDRSFEVKPGSSVAVNIGGGNVTTTTGASGVVRVTLHEEVTADSEEDATAVVAEYDIATRQDGNRIVIVAQRKNGVSWSGWSRSVRVSATLEVPEDVTLDLHTSGGAIDVGGSRTATLRADTSGGSVKVEGGVGHMTLSTSGGFIEVERALGALSAETSGGNIRIGYVGPRADDVTLSTSGGGIEADVNRSARLEVAAETSGGSVSVEDLPFETNSRGRSLVTGTMNGGGGRLRAHTSGGSIVIRGAGDRD